MPATIRKIKGEILLEDHYIFSKPLTGEQDQGIAVFEFNKSLNYKGGTLGKFIAQRKRKDTVVIKVKQDLNDDGKFSKNELIYKGKVKDVEDVDELINFEGKIKIKKQMHSCDWQIMKGDNPIFCTLDYVPEYTELMLKPAGTKKKDMLLDYQFPLFTNETETIGIVTIES